MSPFKSLQLMLIVSEAIIFFGGLVLSRLFEFSMLYTYLPMIIFFFVYLKGLMSYYEKHGIVDKSLMGDD